MRMKMIWNTRFVSSMIPNLRIRLIVRTSAYVLSMTASALERTVDHVRDPDLNPDLDLDRNLSQDQG